MIAEDRKKPNRKGFGRSLVGTHPFEATDKGKKHAKSVNPELAVPAAFAKFPIIEQYSVKTSIRTPFS